MEQTLIAFGKTLRALRKQANLTQEELGFEADLQRIYISKLELGQQQPSLTTLFKLARGLNCSVSDMLKAVEAQLAETS
ncbi:transcriptional regulator [Pasteurellaceae bacterium RH1A]|nr:transcriptional regulator [Pasteurellaceae bacterium RH1A]